MVKLDRIYTRGGDGGMTSLVGGERVAKSSLRMAAIGDVDETNAAIGTVRFESDPGEVAVVLRRLQNDLFDLGADLATPWAVEASREGAGRGASLRVTAAQVEWLEGTIDALNERLAPLDSFVLPGGTPQAAALHLARTVCRRAERSVSALALEGPGNVSPQAAAYVNRLSDLLFVMARVANADGASDVKWVPGANR